MDWLTREGEIMNCHQYLGYHITYQYLKFPCIMISPTVKRSSHFFNRPDPIEIILTHSDDGLSWWFIINWNPMNKLQQNLYQNTKHFISENTFATCKYMRNVSHFARASKVLKDSTFWWWNQNILGVHWVNILAADALASCITRP